MRRSEIEAKYNQFVQVNERLLRFINGEEIVFVEERRWNS